MSALFHLLKGEKTRELQAITEDDEVFESNHALIKKVESRKRENGMDESVFQNAGIAEIEAIEANQ